MGLEFFGNYYQQTEPRSPYPLSGIFWGILVGTRKWVIRMRLASVLRTRKRALIIRDSVQDGRGNVMHRECEVIYKHASLVILLPYLFSQSSN